MLETSCIIVHKIGKGESHLRKYGLFSLLMFIALILAACGSESKEDVIDSVKEHMDEVESYETELDLDITVSVDGDVFDQGLSHLKVAMNEKTLENSGVATQEDQKIEYYSTKDATYAQVNDMGWEDATAQEDQYKVLESDYKSVAQVLVDLKDVEDLEMEKEDDTFVFTFTGKSEDVFKAMEPPYNLEVEGAEIKDIEHDLTIIVDSETYYIEEINSDMSVEVESEKLEIVIAHSYNKFNEIDEVEIPEEVIAEADSAQAVEEEEDEEEEVNEDEDKEDNTSADGELEARTFVAEEMGMELTLVYYHQGDKVVKQTSETIIPYEAIGVESKEEAKEMFEPQLEQMQGVDGLISEMDFGDDALTEFMEVNYEELDFDAARGLPGIMFDEEAEKSGVSMEKSAQMLLEQGYTEVE